MKNNNTDAYYAGLFDGEGTFSIQVQKRYYNGVASLLFSPRMTMTLKYGTDVLEELAQEYGGVVYAYADGTKRWHLGKKAETKIATQRLLPHLRIKKNIAENFLGALELYRPRKGVNLYGGERMWNKERATRMVEFAHNLNPYSKTKNKEQHIEALQEIFDEV